LSAQAENLYLVTRLRVNADVGASLTRLRRRSRGFL
jgi:hypothetical protein